METTNDVILGVIIQNKQGLYPVRDKLLTREQLDKLLALMPNAKCIIVRSVTEEEIENRKNKNMNDGTNI